jgi:hypothetical protein
MEVRTADRGRFESLMCDSLPAEKACELFRNGGRLGFCRQIEVDVGSAKQQVTNSAANEEQGHFTRLASPDAGLEGFPQVVRQRVVKLVYKVGAWLHDLL